MTTRIASGWNSLDTDSRLHGASPQAMGTVTLVGAETLTTILSYTANGINRISQISCSGQEYAKYQLFIDAILKDTRRSGPSRNVDFMFNAPLILPKDAVLDVKVTHYVLGENVDFEATIYGYKGL